MEWVKSRDDTNSDPVVMLHNEVEDGWDETDTRWRFAAGRTSYDRVRTFQTVSVVSVTRGLMMRVRFSNGQ